VGEGAVGNVGTEQMDLLAWRTGRVDREALVVERLWNVRVEEALDGIDRNAEASADSLLCFGYEVAAASTELEDAFAGL
jgi:hypothetical protein